MNQWYFVKEGKQEGPVTAPQLASLVNAGVINSSDLMVWRDGLPEWQSWQASGIQDEISVLPKPSLSQPTPTPTITINPYSVSERAQSNFGSDLAYTGPGYSGYGRLRYFLTIMVITIVFYAVVIGITFGVIGVSNSPGTGTFVGMGLIFLVLMALFMAASFYAAVQRARNLGMSGWAVLWSLVPIMNIWIGWRMIACPEGYEDHRTLDLPGKVITGIWIGFLVLSVASSFLSEL